jgi:hypothetical protein
VLWRCLACTTRYAASLAVCPHCRSTEREEDGVMPKTHVERGPSYAGHVDVASEATAAPDWRPAPEAVDEPAPVEVIDPEPLAARKRTRKQ